MIATNKPLSQTGSDVGDQAAQGADNAIKSTQRYANEALNTLSDKVQDVRDQAVPVLNRVAEKAETLARRGVDAVKDGSQQIRESALRVSDSTVGYIKDEPVKAILIAAATGAALMALISLMTRSRD
ncbi:MAG TPA: hypothetical protein VKI18_01650 [Albitalea sp.]|nr:hypothetical protein [Albitalea sp.]